MAATKAIKRISKKVTQENLEEDLKILCRIVHPVWKNEDICYEKLSGGLLNQIYKCYRHNTQEGALIVRIYTNQDVCDLVDRNREIIGMQVGHAAGVCEPLQIIFDNGLVYGYAPGKTVNWGLLWDDHVARKYVGSLAKFHMTDPAKINLFDHHGKESKIVKSDQPQLFNKLRDVIRNTQEELKNFPERNKRMKQFWTKDRFLEEIDLLEEHFTKFNMNLTYSHNDIWVNNVVYDKDTDTLSLLDFEYCDYCYEAYDLGILFNCFQLFESYRAVFPRNIMIPTDDEMKLPRTEEHRKKLVKFYMEEKCVYLGKDPNDYTEKEFHNFYTQTEMISMMVNLYWTLFGLSQADNPTVKWNILGACERAFEMYCNQRETIFKYQPR